MFGLFNLFAPAPAKKKASGAAVVGAPSMLAGGAAAVALRQRGTIKPGTFGGPLSAVAGGAFGLFGGRSKKAVI